MKQFILVFIGGGGGSILRYVIGKALNNHQTGIPIGTFVANILGSLLIGFVLGLSLKYQALTQNHILLLATGFCGGVTTFSTFVYENHFFLKSGDFINFTIYSITSFIIGVIAVFLGIFIVKFI